MDCMQCDKGVTNLHQQSYFLFIYLFSSSSSSPRGGLFPLLQRTSPISTEPSFFYKFSFTVGRYNIRCKIYFGYRKGVFPDEVYVDSTLIFIYFGLFHYLHVMFILIIYFSN